MKIAAFRKCSLMQAALLAVLAAFASAICPEERRFILLHEMHERYLMSQGWNYNKAHRDSSRIEFKCRLHPEELDGALQEEIRKNVQISVSH
jgi:hypothetical protein